MKSNPIATQISYQIKRQFKIKTYERLNLIVSFVIAPALALLSAIIFRSDIDLVQNIAYPNFLFFMLISGVFFGLVTSVFEIIKDRLMVQRERIGGVSVFSYYISKYYVLGVFGLIQSILYNLIGMFFLKIPIVLFVFNSFIMFMVVMVSIAFGLFVSSLTRSVLIASNMIPILIVPQILLGGLIPYENMDKLIYMWSNDYTNPPPITKIIPVRYAYESIITGNVTFTIGENEINDQISQMVDYLQDNQFMSIEKDNYLSFIKLHIFHMTWFYDIFVIVFFIILSFIVGYIIFFRRIYNG